MADGLNGARWFIALVSMVTGFVNLANQISRNEPVEFGIPLISIGIGIVALALGPVLRVLAVGGPAEEHGGDAGVSGESSDDH